MGNEGKGNGTKCTGEGRSFLPRGVQRKEKDSRRGKSLNLPTKDSWQEGGKGRGEDLLWEEGPRKGGEDSWWGKGAREGGKALWRSWWAEEGEGDEGERGGGRVMWVSARGGDV